ncbi:hypothetical protein [Streptomyces ipomoeae]|uniref:hypothetical protein n=1 Tax=Streptomyces ipomoeae TaxID=103232 RepID=UPI00215B9947|nr:hypothetical protein [Streptomyces ipomoeae]
MPRRPQQPPAAGAPARPTAPPRPTTAPTSTPGTPGDARRPGTTADGQRLSYASGTTRPSNGSGDTSGPAPSRTTASGPAAGPRPPRTSTGDGDPAQRRAEHPRFADFRRTTGQSGNTPAAPPPPAASARFPDAPPKPRPQEGAPPPASARFPDTPPVSPLRRPLPEEVRPETVTPRPRSVESDRGGGWQPASGASRRSAEAIDAALGAPPGRPFVTLAQPDTSAWAGGGSYDGRRRSWPSGTRAAAVAACVVLGVGLIGGAAAGSWLTGDSGTDAARGSFTAAEELWHSVPVDELFPPTVRGEGAGPGGTDRTWTRIAVAPDSGCADAFDPLLHKALTPVGCLRLLRATYTDATRSSVTTVGMMFTKADAADMAALKVRFAKDGLDRRTDLMPRPYAAEDTVAAGFGDGQRASWTISVLTDVPVVVYAVSGFADGRTVTEPQPAEDAMQPGATTAPAQSGLGHEAQGLADRIERGLRKTAASATEQPS